MFSFFFPSIRFNHFAYQAEKIADFIFEHQPIKQWPFHPKLLRYLDYRSDMAEMLVHFNQQTSTAFGWISSWIPFTNAYASRQSISIALSMAKDLYNQINTDYCRHINDVMKKQLYTPSINSMLAKTPTNQSRATSLFSNNKHHDHQSEIRRHSAR
ncbi:MAG: hypothetical protein WAW86_10520 [Gammaproteobacteria bacterium]